MAFVFEFGNFFAPVSLSETGFGTGFVLSELRFPSRRTFGRQHRIIGRAENKNFYALVCRCFETGLPLHFFARCGRRHRMGGRGTPDGWRTLSWRGRYPRGVRGCGRSYIERRFLIELTLSYFARPIWDWRLP